MITKKILYAGQPGTKKWIKKYGPKLIAVRYKYDHNNCKKMITVELEADLQDWNRDMQRIPNNKKVKLKINYGEIDLGIKVKSFGGVWNKKEGVWECKYETVKALGLTNRIVDNAKKSL